MKENEEEPKSYDRLFKENVDNFIPFIEWQLKIEITKIKKLPVEVIKTVARAVDYLCEIEIDGKDKYLLHIEFQTRNDHQMIYRMAEYHGFLLKKYKLPIKHVVLYLGSSKVDMKAGLPSKMVFESFQLINLSKIDASKLISSQIPEVLILGVLGSYEKEDREQILKSIIRKIRQLNFTTEKQTRYFRQLLVLARLRNLENNTYKLIEDMPVTLEHPITEDGVYKRGFEEGKEEGALLALKENIKSFLILGTYSNQELAKIMKVEVSLVEEVEEQMNS